MLSAANMGPDTNTSHLSILVAPAPHLDGHYTIFGEVVRKGMGGGWGLGGQGDGLSLPLPMLQS